MKHRKVPPKRKHIVESLQYYTRGDVTIAIEWYLCGRHYDRGNGPKIIGDEKCSRCFNIARGLRQ